MASLQQLIVISIVVLSIFVFWFLVKFISAIWDFAGLGAYDIQIIGEHVTVTTLIAFVLVGGAIIYILKRNDLKTLIGEVILELKNVKWPAKSELILSTIVVIVMVVIVSIILGVFDYVWALTTDFLWASVTGSDT